MIEMPELGRVAGEAVEDRPRASETGWRLWPLAPAWSLIGFAGFLVVTIFVVSLLMSFAH